MERGHMKVRANLLAYWMCVGGGLANSQETRKENTYLADERKIKGSVPARNLQGASPLTATREYKDIQPRPSKSNH